MKRTILLVSLLLAAGLLMAALQGCKGPEGPAGPAGESKILQLEGFAADINCGDCHNPDTDSTYFVWAKKYQWELSKHFFGGDFERNSTPCSGCHTTEGYVDRAKANFPIQSAWTGVVNSHFDASPPGCFACHSPHSNGDFQLRTEAAVTMLSPMKNVSNQSINMGKGNLCLNCHQPRSLSPTMFQGGSAPLATDTLKITSNRWYPHYGVQGLMFKGPGGGGGYEFPGKTYSSSFHATSAATNGTTLQQEGCLTCHMAPSNTGGGFGGGHTMNVKYLNTSGADTWNTTGCLVSGCHSTMASVDNYVSSSSSLTGGKGVHIYIHESIDTLHSLLISKALLDSASGLVMGNNGTSTASSSNPKTFVGSQIQKAGALYNYFFLEHDLSGGVHNSMYAIQLIKDSIEELRKP